MYKYLEIGKNMMLKRDSKNARAKNAHDSGVS